MELEVPLIVVYQRFDNDYLLTLRYYAIKFDYGFIFTYTANIIWLHNIHQKIDFNVAHKTFDFNL